MLSFKAMRLDGLTQGGSVDRKGSGEVQGINPGHSVLRMKGGINRDDKKEE